MAHHPNHSSGGIGDDHQDRLARALPRLHQEVTGLGDALADAVVDDDFNDPDPDPDLAERLRSAKRVIELLAKMRPASLHEANNENEAIEIGIDHETCALNAASTLRGLGKRIDGKTLSEQVLPTTIGRFEIQSLIGQGGFGMVFLARDPDLERVVALKVPTINSLLKDDAQHRFQQESRAIAALNHPNIVPIYEVGNEGPISFLASEFVDGTDLAKWIEKHGPLDPRHAAEVVVVIADAIQHAHLRHVIHRDLKPANILLETSDSESSFAPESIRVTDFGLAKVLERGKADLTQTGCLIGTPAFSAPEQLQPIAGQKPTERADVYSLGAILYFVLTGQAPFSGENLIDLIRIVQTNLPLSPVQWNPCVPRELAAICLKALEKNPSDRYDTASQLRDDLVRFQNGESVVAHPIAWPTKLVRLAKRNPSIASLLLITSLAIAAGMASTLYQWNQTRRSLVETQRQKERSDRLLLETEYAVDRMLTRTSDGLANLPAFTKFREQLLQDALEIQLSILQHEQDNESSSSRLVDVHARLARIQLELGLTDKAKESCHAAINRYERISEPTVELSIVVSQVLRKLGDIELGQLDLDKAKSSAKRSLDILSQWKDRVDADAMPSQRIRAEADALRLLGKIEESQNHLDAALGYFDLGILRLNSLPSKNDEESFDQRSELASAFNSLAIVQRKLGNAQLARKSYESSLAANETLVQQAPWRRDVREKMAITCINLGNLIFNEFESAQAGPYYQRSAELLGELVQQFPMVTSYQANLTKALNGISLVQKRAGDLESSKETIELAISKIETMIAQAGVSTALLSEQAAAYKRLASIHSDLKEYPAADEAFANAFAIYEKLVHENPKFAPFRYSQALCRGSQAESLLARQEYARAAALLDEGTQYAEIAVELIPTLGQYQRLLVDLQRRRFYALTGAGEVKQCQSLISDVAQQELKPDQHLQWAACAAECLELSESKSLTNPLKDFAFSQIDAAFEGGFSDVVGLNSDARFKPIQSDPRFQRRIK